MPNLHDGVEFSRPIILGDLPNAKLDNIAHLHVVLWRNIKTGRCLHFSCALTATTIDTSYTDTSVPNVMIGESS
jgi:hypothetical protein